MKGELIKTTTSDGLVLHGILCEPKKHWHGEATAVLHIHGMAGNFYENAFISTICESAVSSGNYFCSVNTRGAGLMTDFLVVGKKEKIKTIGQMYEKLSESDNDIEAWMSYLETKGINKIILSGHSLGCVKIILYFKNLKDQSRFKKIIVLSPPDMIGLIEKRDEIENHKKNLIEAKKLIKNNKPEQILSLPVWRWYEMCAASYIDFFETYKSNNVFPVSESEIISSLSDITVPVLVVFGEKDDIAINTITRDSKKYHQSLINENSRVAIIKDADHGYNKNTGELGNVVFDFLNK